MRVIHHDGRVGRCDCNITVMRGNWEVRFWFGVAPLTYERVRAGDLRPLGPIEEELRARKPGDAMSPGVQEMYLGCWANLGRCSSLDVMSEALEACARIWDQHGEAL